MWEGRGLRGGKGICHRASNLGTARCEVDGALRRARPQVFQGLGVDKGLDLGGAVRVAARQPSLRQLFPFVEHHGGVGASKLAHGGSVLVIDHHEALPEPGILCRVDPVDTTAERTARVGHALFVEGILKLRGSEDGKHVRLVANDFMQLGKHGIQPVALEFIERNERPANGAGPLFARIFPMRVLAAQMVRTYLDERLVHLDEAGVHGLRPHTHEALVDKPFVEALHDIVHEVTHLDGAEAHIEAPGGGTVAHEPTVGARQIVLDLRG